MNNQLLQLFIIAEYGPLIHHADRTLEKSLNEHWKDHNIIDGSWPFLSHSHDIRSYTGNTMKVVGKPFGGKINTAFHVIHL